MVEIKPVNDYRIGTGNNCEVFSGLIVNVNGVATLIKYPYSSSLRDGVVTVYGSDGSSVSFSNNEYGRHKLDYLNDNWSTDAQDDIPTLEPAKSGFWLDGDTLMFYNGNESKVIDYNEGEMTDVFGNPIGSDN